MLESIEKCSLPILNAAFDSLNQFKDYVFWIRSHDMSKQIYISPSYASIWGQDPALLYEIPLIWLDYLALDNRTLYMKLLQTRHEQNYFDPQKNFVLFQITKGRKKGYILDQCFRCQGKSAQYIVACSKLISVDAWHIHLQNTSPDLSDQDIAIANEFFTILKQVFAISKINPAIKNDMLSDSLGLDSYAFSKREYECLSHLCQGKTYKHTARAMGISPRTVETHLENIRLKTACGNKVEVVSRFARYFIDATPSLEI